MVKAPKKTTDARIIELNKQLRDLRQEVDQLEQLVEIRDNLILERNQQVNEERRNVHELHTRLLHLLKSSTLDSTALAYYRNREVQKMEMERNSAQDGLALAR